MLDDIGYKFFPSLLDINNQDRLLIVVACLVSYLFGAFITLYWQNGFLRQFYKPLELLQRHMSKTIQGNFGQAALTQTHEIHGDELIKTYNYLYSSIQSNLKRDIIFLQELENVHAPELARVLINEKMEQLSLYEAPEPVQSVKQEKQKFKTAN